LTAVDRVGHEADRNLLDGRMNEAGNDQPQPAPTPWYKSVLFRMAMLVLFALGFSWVLGFVVRAIAPF
jgi:hypothetical protein